MRVKVTPGKSYLFSWDGKGYYKIYFNYGQSIENTSINDLVDLVY